MPSCRSGAEAQGGKRKAVVYVRQSTQAQVQTNLESQRRQYELVDEARRRGFRDVEVIDDDLGRSASGMVARPGFERLVAWLCAGEVGAVLCFDASRLARNGRDWHHLLELCGLVEARVIDLDGVYDPCRPNDRLLLGMKGSISEFELGVLRARMLDAARAKARRGELRISVPIGYIWHREIGLGFDPDLRIQEAIRLIFARFRELGSARQVLLSMTEDQVHFPRPSDGKKLVDFRLDADPLPQCDLGAQEPVLRGSSTPTAKARSAPRSSTDGLRKSYGHGKPLEEWEVLLKDHHEGYIDWAEFERNQKQLAVNAYGKVGGAKSGRGGRALLAGLLSCGRCGRRLMVSYSGRRPGQPVYRCDRPNLMLGLPRCLTFGGPRVDAAVARELLRAVEPMAIEAAVEAERRHMEARAKTAHRGAGAAAGALRSLACGTALRCLRSRQSLDRRAAREELGSGAAPGGRDVRGAAGGGADVPDPAARDTGLHRSLPTISKPPGTRQASPCALASGSCAPSLPTSSPMSTTRRARSS